MKREEKKEGSKRERAVETPINEIDTVSSSIVNDVIRSRCRDCCVEGKKGVRSLGPEGRRLKEGEMEEEDKREEREAVEVKGRKERECAEEEREQWRRERKGKRREKIDMR